MTAAGGAWVAPTVNGPLDATVRLPGSKSITNRALVLAALADGPSTIRRPLRARDTDLMVAALSALGARITDRPGRAANGGDSLVVEPRFAAPVDTVRIDCGLAGTVMRFVPPIAGLMRGRVELDGDPRARERPMAPLLDALRRLGVAVDDGANQLPFGLYATGSVRGGTATLDASTSSQFVSGLLLAAARYDEGLDVRHDGKPMPSQPHVAMTVAMLRERGVAVDDGEPNRWVVAAGTIKPLDATVEPDLSSAAPFLAAALVCGGRVTVPRWPRSTTQPGDALRWILAEFGADVDWSESELTVAFDIDGTPAGRGRTLTGVDLDLHDVGELTPVVAALAVLADGPSRLRGVAHLRGHETDRLDVLATQLSACGADCRQTADGLLVRPARLHGATFHTGGDHRMAHAAAVLGLVVPGIEIDDPAVTAKTHPDFVGAWTAMLA